jgi:hypothetical protein
MSSLTELRLGLLENGWHPLPVIGKACRLPNWTNYCSQPPTREEIIRWEEDRREERSTGIATGHIVAIDIDVASSIDLVERLRAEAFDCFGETPFIRVGRAPRIALIYRAGEEIRKRAFKAESGLDDGIEVLGVGQQFVAFGIHPTTERPYEWVGSASPTSASPDVAPLISSHHLDEFLARTNCLMPFLGSPSQKRSGMSGTGAPIRRDEQSGLVVDGRENFLHLCVWSALCELHQSGEPILAASVAEIAWTKFADLRSGADLSDGKWRFKSALAKARGKVRKYNDGSLKLGVTSVYIEPTYPDLAKPAPIARKVVSQAVSDHLAAIEAYEETLRDRKWFVDDRETARALQP